MVAALSPRSSIPLVTVSPVRMDPFRDGVAEIRLGEEIRGHVATSEHLWSPGRPLTMQERVFPKVTWA